MYNQIVFEIFLLAFITCISLCKGEDPVVETQLGSIKGRFIKSYDGRTVAAFEGIPYAKPPIGELRFEEPQPIEPWSDELLANKTYVCMQYTYLTFSKGATGDEDCLYLYIYVPRETTNKDEKLNVVVHIHGGGFTVGDPTSLAGPNYIMDRDLIYVTMNYRLGILGFLSTEDDVVPGNNGLKDQALAIKWVKENIESFGGNPDSITLTGVSAGGASVHYHYFSPLSKGLFHRGFSMSGTVLNPWALTRNPLKNALKVGEAFNCDLSSTKELVDCLKKIPGKNLTATFYDFLIYYKLFPSNCFSPTIEPNNYENAFLPDHPYKLLQDGKFNDYPWVVSNTKDEGIIPVGFFVLFHKLSEFDKRWNEVLPYTLTYYDTADENDKIFIAEKVKDFYLNNESLSMENVFSVIKLHSDRLFLSGTEDAARLQAKMGRSPVYYYNFEYHIHIPVFFKAKLPVVGHADDFIIFHHHQRNPKVLQDEDNEMKNVFIDFLFNYADKGLPKFKDVEWVPISSNEGIDYMKVSSPNDVQAKHSKDIGKSSFWNSLPLKENANLFNK